MSRGSPALGESLSCRGCEAVDVAAVVRLPGFPKAAQFLPLPEELSLDQPITLEVCECQRCGLIQLSNDPVWYYRDVITTASISGESRRALASEFKELIPDLVPATAVCLEIGAGRGDFVSLLNEIGLSASGLENGEDNVRVCRQRGIHILQGTIETLEPEVKYDLIVVNNFLEHQPSPQNFLRSAREHLKEGGVLYVSVPSLDFILSTSCLYEFVADHLVYFRPRSLRVCAETAGLEMLKIYKKNNDNDLVGVFRRPQSIDWSRHRIEMEATIESVKRLCERAASDGKRVAIWGAGHRACALMSLGKLHEIDVVVDSATFKQGRLTPVLNKLIVPPQRLVEEHFDLVVVMLPGAYADQALTYLSARNVKSKVIVFKDLPL